MTTTMTMTEAHEAAHETGSATLIPVADCPECPIEEVAVPDPEQPAQYWGPAEVGAMFGVTGHVVDVWRRRYSPDRTPEQIAKAPTCPQPDIVLGVVRPQVGWDPARADEWRAWHASRPGSGAGGGRPRKDTTV